MNSRLFFQLWLTYIVDKGISSLRDLFHHLEHTGTPAKLSTFSKANKQRGFQLFNQIYLKLLAHIRSTHKSSDIAICPFDSTIISLTSKLFWAEKYHQVKVLSSLNLQTGATSEPLIHFGQKHDMSFGEMVLSTMPENGVAVGDRGFASRELFTDFIQSHQMFVIRINLNWKMSENYDLETAQGRVRVVWFCDLETEKEYRIATNIAEEVMTNEEIAEVYRQRWQIEVLWKFLKMHLKLDRLATKSLNGVTIQIYMVLIVYLLLQLIEIPKIYGKRLLDKLRYLQIVIRQEANFIHWMNHVATDPQL
jgi:putative transposase